MSNLLDYCEESLGEKPRKKCHLIVLAEPLIYQESVGKSLMGPVGQDAGLESEDKDNPLIYQKCLRKKNLSEYTGMQDSEIEEISTDDGYIPKFGNNSHQRSLKYTSNTYHHY